MAELAQIIHVRVFPPFRRWVDGRTELYLEVEGPISVREMWSRLALTSSQFRHLQAHQTEEDLARVMHVLQNGHVLGPNDVVTPEVPVELLPSIAGGHGSMTDGCSEPAQL